MKNRLWRCLSGCLHTLQALRARGIQVNDYCLRCNRDIESDIHALITCPFACDVWIASSIGYNIDDSVSLVGWWNNLKRRCSPDKLDLIATILWCICKSKDSWVWNNTSSPPVKIVEYAETCLAKWRSTKDVVAVQSDGPSAQMVKWSKPHVGKLKCNVDNNLLSNPNRSGYGCVLHNDQGKFVASMSSFVMGKHDPLMAEAFGVREALSWLKQLQLKNMVVVESDSLNLISYLVSDEKLGSSVGLIVNDCKSLQKEFDLCAFLFARRSANSTAHCLAKAVCSALGQGCWLDVPPVIIFDVLFTDLY